jgi:hypothetical protein
MELQWRHSDCRVGASATVYIHTYMYTVLVTKYLKLRVQICQHFIEGMNYGLSARTSSKHRM